MNQRFNSNLSHACYLEKRSGEGFGEITGVSHYSLMKIKASGYGEGNDVKVRMQKIGYRIKIIIRNVFVGKK